MFKLKEVIFVKSIVDQKNRPKPYLPEFAFAGRSNVGKSSLINCLVNRSNFAHVSKSPGKTRTINYYQINDVFYLVDLPGYGFARVSKSEKGSWQKMIENYLLQNHYLKTVFVLIDCRVGLKKSDLELFEWLHFHLIPFTIILTKADQVNKNGQAKIISELLATLKQVSRNQILIFSAKNRMGREELLAEILRKSEDHPAGT